MIKKTLLLVAFLSIKNLTAQNLFFQTGKNITSYDFNSSQVASTLDYRSSNGNFYEIGYDYNFKSSNFNYSASIILNQFNALASGGTTAYSWNTNYLGIQNMIGFNIFLPNTDFKITIKTGINASHIIKGEQFINNTFYDVRKHKEFTGLFIQPIISLTTNYNISEKISLSLGYNYSVAFNLSNSSDEKLSFNTNQFQFGLYFPLN